jgi:hypothetical protein
VLCVLKQKQAGPNSRVWGRARSHVRKVCGIGTMLLLKSLENTSFCPKEGRYSTSPLSTSCKHIFCLKNSNNKVFKVPEITLEKYFLKKNEEISFF